MSGTDIEIFRARHIETMAADAPLTDGAVAVKDSRIVAVGGSQQVLAACHGRVCDFGNAIVLPGLVNAHTHLELSALDCGGSVNGSFADWIIALRDRQQSSNIDTGDAVRMGVAQCVRYGVTTVGDIARQFEVSRPILRDGPLRAVSFGEALGLAKLRPRFEQSLKGASDSSFNSAHLTCGISPHAPYTVDLDGYRECVTLAAARPLPISTHLAETRDEHAFLLHQSGPLRDLWNRLDLWQAPVSTFPGSPVEMAHSVGLLNCRAVLAHVNFVDASDLELLSRGNASVVYCPRTHRYFCHAIHPWREMLERGINVCVGTDSCASSPNLNLVDELRLLHLSAQKLPVRQLWRLATINGARALQLDDSLGSLERGKLADFVVFPVQSDEPLLELLSASVLPSYVYIGGVRCFPDDSWRSQR